MKAFVILNEQHSLLPDQEKVLNEAFTELEIVSVPAEGWTAEEIRKRSEYLVIKCYQAKGKAAVVFASPIPLMIMEMVRFSHYYEWLQVKLLHNDARVKKEIPGGKIITTIAMEGWQLL